MSTVTHLYPRRTPNLPHHSSGEMRGHNEVNTWKPAIAGYSRYLTAADRAEGTVYLRVCQLQQFAEHHPDPWAVTTDDLVAWLSRGEWATETRRSMRSALRGFYRWAVVFGAAGEDDPAQHLPTIRPAPACARPTPEQVLADALRQADQRVRVMILLAARQGLRRAEIAAVHRRDVVGGPGGWSLVVHGKGRRDRVIPLHDDMAQLLLLHAAEGAFLFPGRTKGHLAPYWVGRLVSRYLPDGWTTHTLRHRFATVAYAGSRDLLAVQALLGHSRPETTQRYVRLPDDAMRAAMRHAA